MKRFLITADTHFTDRPRDEYRFGLLPWLGQQQQKYDTTATFILGDLCDSKDKHSAALVNRIVNSLIQLRPPVFILKGNHDFIDPNNPFFGFLDHIDGIHFIKEPTFLAEHGVAMIPHQPDQASFDDACKRTIRKGCAVMLHQLLDGAIGESGSRLTGIKTSLVSEMGAGVAWAGDVHKPQLCGPVAYCGAPYHVRYGDDFTPRVLLIENWVESDLHFQCPGKFTVEIADPAELKGRIKALQAGDQVRLTVNITREEASEWPAMKKVILDECRNRGLVVGGINLAVIGGSSVSPAKIKTVTKQDAFSSFCKAEKLSSQVKQIGQEILDA